MTASLQDLFGLEGKIALVTDSGGLSSVDVAPLLSMAGAQLIVADTDEEKGAKLADAIMAEGGRVISLPTDITSQTAVADLFTEIRSRHGRCDIVVNCAGITSTAPISETSLETYDDLHALNQRATFLIMREAVRLMLDHGTGGRIVNVTTMGTLHPVLNGNAAYAATRASVTAMTRAVALDHAGDGILANVVLPGAIPGKTRFHGELQQRLAGGGTITGPAIDPARILLGYGQGADIAAAVLYLAGPAGRYLTGQSITLDGGFLLS